MHEELVITNNTGCPQTALYVVEEYDLVFPMDTTIKNKKKRKLSAILKVSHKSHGYMNLTYTLSTGL